MKFKVNVMKGLMMSAFMFLLCSYASAQRTISGTITDSKTGEALIGANILAVGTESGTSTDIDGTYSLQVPAGITEVEITYTGYASQKVTLGASNIVNISMSEGALIDEIVVIGYGTIKKSDLTGSISKVGEKDFNKGAIISPEQLLEGRTTGVQITGSSGAPGAAASINIRGTSSIRSGNAPLIVIDGIQLDNRSVTPGGEISGLGTSPGNNPFSFIDPNEIASMEVLKDASATAIYGSRGANGVILITTKKGQTGEPTIEYNVQQGMSTIAKKPDYLSASDFRSALSTESLGNANDFGADVDALDSVLQTGYTNSHSLSINGGSGKFNYRVFGSIFKQDGIVIHSGLDKYVGGIKSSFKAIDDRLTIDFGLTTSSINQQNAPVSNNAGFQGSLIGAALQWNPTKALRKADGSFDQDISEARNPLAMNEYIQDKFNIQRIIGNVGATFKIVDGLNYKFSASYDNARGERRAGISPALNFNDIFDRGQAIVGNNKLGSIQYTHTLNYQADVSESISLNVLGGYEYLKYTNKGTNIFVTDLAKGSKLDYTDILQSANNNNQRVESFHDPDVELQSVFGRAIFNMKDRYLLTATVRSDASSKFGEDNKSGIFPSFAAAWNISNEDFSPAAFNNLKLRLGWGVTGNQEFPAGASQQYFEYTNGNLTQRNNPNPELAWESSEQFNIGLDFAILDYKITGTIDYFNKKTNDLILFVPLAQPNPSSDGRIYRNVDGTITNSGVELGLNATIVDNTNVTWGAGLNLTFLSNEVDGFSSAINTGGINGQGLSGAFAQRIANGQPLFSYYLPVYAGLNEEGLSTYEAPGGGTTLIGTVNSVKQFVGDPLPDLLVGFNTYATFGDFDVTLNMSGAYGHEIYNNTANAVFVKGNIANGRNISSDLVGNGESVNNSYPASTRYLEDGGHLRLSNLTFGYTMNKDNLPSFLKGARFSLTGQNLFVITNYSGFDPVVNTDKQIAGIPSFGIEYTPYPTSRTILASLSIKF